MRNFLVVAHKTLIEEQLIQELQELARRAPAAFYVVVPVDPPFRQAWTEGGVRAVAAARLREGLAALRAAGLTVEGEVGDGHPVEAVQQLLRRGDVPVDEIVLSTLPPGISRWIGMDVPHRMAEAVHPIPVHHVTAHRAPTSL